MLSCTWPKKAKIYRQGTRLHSQPQHHHHHHYQSLCAARAARLAFGRCLNEAAADEINANDLLNSAKYCCSIYTSAHCSLKAQEREMRLQHYCTLICLTRRKHAWVLSVNRVCSWGFLDVLSVSAPTKVHRRPTYSYRYASEDNNSYFEVMLYWYAMCMCAYNTQLFTPPSCHACMHALLSQSGLVPAVFKQKALNTGYTPDRDIF